MDAVPIDERLRQRCVEAVAREGERFGVLAQQVDAGLTAAPGLHAPVPWVPAWTVRGLVGHLQAGVFLAVVTLVVVAVGTVLFAKRDLQ